MVGLLLGVAATPEPAEAERRATKATAAFMRLIPILRGWVAPSAGLEAERREHVTRRARHGTDGGLRYAAPALQFRPQAPPKQMPIAVIARFGWRAEGEFATIEVCAVRLGLMPAIRRLPKRRILGWTSQPTFSMPMRRLRWSFIGTAAKDMGARVIAMLRKGPREWR